MKLLDSSNKLNNRQKNNMDDNQIKINTLEILMNQVTDDIKYIREKLDHLEDIFVTRKEFGPVQKIVYGLVGTIITTVLLALIYQVIIK